MTTVIPHLTCRNAFEAIDFYVRAFGAKNLSTTPGPDGKMMHGSIQIGGGTIYLVDEFPDFNALSPLSLNGSPVTIHLQTDDGDAVFNRAVEAGCTVVMPLELQFWGDKYGLLEDPYGHRWSVGQTVEEKTPEQIHAALAAMGSDPQCGAGQ